MASSSPSHLVLMMMMVLMVSSCIVAATAETWPGSAAAAAAGAGYSNMYGRGYYAGDMAGAATRRVLDDTTTAYISYAALTANSVPCSTAGASYYDCLASDAANPYTRSCTTITLCARDTS